MDLNGPAVNAAIDKAADNTLEASAEQHSDHTGQAEVAVNRTWANGWDVTAYAKAWWKGDKVIDTGGGVRVRKTF